MPTARNAHGVDIVIYSQDALRKHTVQVKALSGRSAVPLGKHVDHLFADYVIICRHATREDPECFILAPEEARSLVSRNEKEGRISLWLEPRQYEADRFRENWGRIGSGILDTGPAV